MLKACLAPRNLPAIFEREGECLTLQKVRLSIRRSNLCSQNAEHPEVADYFFGAKLELTCVLRGASWSPIVAPQWTVYRNKA